MEPVRSATWTIGGEADRMKRAEQFERIVREYGASVARLAAAFERNPTACEDLVQEIALALWKALAGFRGDCSERTLVYRVAQNRALRHLEQRYRSAVGGEQEPSEVADQRPSPEAAAADGERRARLLEGIRGLPAGQRQVITLVLEGLSHAEIGRVLGISEGNVAVRAVRARETLRRALGDGR